MCAQVLPWVCLLPNTGETDHLVALAPRLADPNADASAEAAGWRALVFDPLLEQLAADEGDHWLCSACSSGLHGVVLAALDLGESGAGECGVVAVDALSPIGIVGFARTGACSRIGPHPFRVERDGLAIGEAAAAVRLSAWEAADVPAVLGTGMSCDAVHPTDPDSSGQHLEVAVRRALAAAGLAAHAVGGVVAHGTGTAKNDAVEAAVLARLWPDGGPPVTSIKGQLGHTMGVAGLLNLLVAVQSLRDGVLPAAAPPGGMGIEGIDLICGAPRALRAGAPILVLASGFGGNNAAVLVGFPGSRTDA